MGGIFLKLLIAGGDARYACLAEQAHAAGWDLLALGLERAAPACTLDQVDQADAVLLNNPWRRGLMLPLTDHPFELSNLFARMRKDALLLLSDAQGAPDALPFRTVDLSRDEDYVRINAQLTAEGAIACAMNGAWALHDRRCLILGYGRIARALTRGLLALRSPVTVCARRANARAQARDVGASVCSFEALNPLIGSFDLIFNTVPEQVIDRTLLEAISAQALLIDLASPPYGFDLADARARGLCARRENGLPGRYCPHSAARALMSAVERALGGVRR